MDIEKVNFTEQNDCDCLFCLSKCPKCLSTNVEIQYQRIYMKDGSIQSYALVSCKCGRSNVKEIKLDEQVIGWEGNQTYYYVEELTKIIDTYFEDYIPIEHDKDVAFVYIIENDTEDYISLCFDYMNDYVEFNEELPNSMNFKIHNKEIEISETRIVA